MSREGRSQPIQPFASHGFLGNTPANGVLPGQILVVEPDDRRRKTPPLQPVIISGVLSKVTAPPDSLVVENDDRRRRTPPLQPFAFSAALLSVIPPAVVAPPRPVVVTPPDTRQRVTPGPVALNGLYSTVTPPTTATPPPPLVVPIEARRRATGGGEISVGWPLDTPNPPAPINVDRADQLGRFRPLDPIALSAALQAGPPPTVTPPGPFVVPIEERRYILDRLRQATVSHGFVGNTPANGVLPPAGQNLDRVDQRTRFLPQPTLVLSGVLAPFIPPPPVVVLAGTDWAAEMSTW